MLIAASVIFPLYLAIIIICAFEIIQGVLNYNLTGSWFHMTNSIRRHFVGNSFIVFRQNSIRFMRVFFKSDKKCNNDRTNGKIIT